MLLVSCESSTTPSNKDSHNAIVKANDADAAAAEARITTIPVRAAEKTTTHHHRVIFRRSKPYMVTYNGVQTPLHTFGEDCKRIFSQNLKFSHTTFHQLSK